MSSIYHINEQIKLYTDNLFDQTTGEVDEQSLKKLSELEMDRTEKIDGLALACLEKRGHIAGFKSEIERIKKLVDRMKKEDEYLVGILNNILTKDEKITTDQYQIKRNKSTAIVMNPDFDIEDLDGDFVNEKIEKTPDKKKIMAELKKKDGFVPGCSIEHREMLKIS